MKVKAKCAWALIRYLNVKESERENSNKLCKTKLYYATCRQRVCGQNKNYLCLNAARTLRAKRTETGLGYYSPSTETIVVALRHVRTTACCNDRLNMFVKTPANWSAHDFNIRSETISGPDALVMSILFRVDLT